MDSLAPSSSLGLLSGRRRRRHQREVPRGLPLPLSLIALHSEMSTVRTTSPHTRTPITPAPPEPPHSYSLRAPAPPWGDAHLAIAIHIPYGKPTSATPYTLPLPPPP
ncbi:hypothetical protein B0H12DRAFT_1229013 [Mycena haematopus]|nr:hypothetical protein B0H12DRAFT_1229013 [Mycena haematopus]